MAADTATVEWRKTSISGMEIVRCSASDAHTLTCTKFNVQAAQITLNHDTDAHVNVVNADGTEIDGTSAQVKLNLAGITTKTVTVTFYGGASVQV